MTKLRDVYVKINSYNYWWGRYGLCQLSGWEDIVIYDGTDEVNKIGYTSICARDYLRSALEDLEVESEEKNFIDRIQAFLSDNKIYYYYYYDDPTDHDFYQLPYRKLPLNGSGVRPRSIEMWHPSKGIDQYVIEECVKEFCFMFLNHSVGHVHFIEPVNLYESIQSYKEELLRFNGSVTFPDSLIHDMMHKLSKSKEEILEILNNSL
ncbi:hypothetical protein L5D93_28995 [Paenibacillus thiaminolyticus]|nr:hypothetical protein [Paenibacillus thiaminolyticus]